MFSISMTDRVSDEGWPVAEITLRGHVESFPLVTTYWSAALYLQQWSEACQQLLAGPQDAAVLLVTSIENPAKSAGFSAYALYRVSNQVFVQDHLVFYKQLKQKFDESKAWAYASPRQTESDGQRISEWEISLNDVHKFVEAALSLPGPMKFSRRN